jgi:AcrR family transcriptional regulator
MTEYAGRGDPRRSMELLWGAGTTPSRGPKPGLTVAAIVEAAIAVADAEGLAALSMRKVAERLGRSAMSLYTYVPGKPELLDVMLDTVIGETPKASPPDGGWRPAVEAAARDQWAFYQRHPWVLQVSGSRALLGPNELAAYEAQLRLFDSLGLTAVEVTRAVSAVSNLVRGSAKAVADARAAEQATGLSDDDWWTARSSLLDELLPPDAFAERFPTATRLEQEHAFDQADRSPDDDTPYTVKEAVDAFEFGLQRLLDGIEAFVASR